MFFGHDALSSKKSKTLLKNPTKNAVLIFISIVSFNHFKKHNINSFELKFINNLPKLVII